MVTLHIRAGPWLVSGVCVCVCRSARSFPIKITSQATRAHRNDDAD